MPGLSHSYRGRLAPTPSGRLHAGHAATFLQAARRAREGTLLLRIEDLDRERCRQEHLEAALVDLRWLGLDWSREGPGPQGAFLQSGRMDLYREAFGALRSAGRIFPCHCSRRDIRMAALAPHEGDEARLYPGTCRGSRRTGGSPSWRFLVPDGEDVSFEDPNLGTVVRRAGRDFGDFPVWRRDGIPSYQLAVVVDDFRMGITEVVRGEDLLVSTCRQILLYRALGWEPPRFVHCPLVRDSSGRRLAKRDGSDTLLGLRQAGLSVQEALLRYGLDSIQEPAGRS